MSQSAHPHAQACFVDLQLAPRFAGLHELLLGDEAMRAGFAEQHDVAQLRCRSYLERLRMLVFRPTG